MQSSRRPSEEKSCNFRSSFQLFQYYMYHFRLPKISFVKEHKLYLTPSYLVLISIVREKP